MRKGSQFRTCALVLVLAGLVSPAGAETNFAMPEDEDAARFVTSNLLATFYHELGHAVIDVLQLPVLGREEDAADTLSSLLIHAIWDEDTATAMTYDVSWAFALYDAEAEAAGADEHSLDLQRYYNLVCLYYGASPEVREDVAAELELPPDRAEGCPSEFEQADAAWGVMLEGLELVAGGKGLRMVGVLKGDPIAELLQVEVDDLNKTYGLPEWVDVTVEACGTANAFYDPSKRRITICREYAADLLRLWESQER
jgi:hypothetical protein